MRSFWNIPNTLTVLRMAAVPLMVVLLWTTPSPAEGMVASAVFVVSMLTDVVDGHLARRWNQVSALGAYLDPLADKLLVATTLIMLIPLGWVPAWIVALLLAREMAVTGLRGIASQSGQVLSAGTLGKIKTAYQSVAIALLLLHYPLLGMDMHSAGMINLWIATAFALWSGWDYAVATFRTPQATS